uniref:Uncharacterized protein n=1 Tax=Arundo donax TaxID=35708 RepID=A0A0A9QF27_ARUDO
MTKGMYGMARPNRGACRASGLATNSHCPETPNQ